jgi:DNA-binding NarL/FixJ family response regulator
MRLTELSKRQQEVAIGIFAGKTLMAIAFELGISPKTVSAHKAVIYRKTKITTDADFIKYMVVETQNTACVPTRVGVHL